MPRFFFDSCIDGVELDDDTGVLIPLSTNVMKEAAIGLYQMATDTVLDRGEVDAVMVVRNDKNEILSTVRLKLTLEQAAAQPVAVPGEDSSD